AVRRVRFIKRAQGLGFSLKEIKALLALRVDPRSSCGDVRKRAGAKIGEIEAKVRMLPGMKKARGRLNAACAGRGRVRHCATWRAPSRSRGSRAAGCTREKMAEAVCRRSG